MVLRDRKIRPQNPPFHHPARTWRLGASDLRTPRKSDSRLYVSRYRAIVQGEKTLIPESQGSAYKRDQELVRNKCGEGGEGFVSVRIITKLRGSVITEGMRSSSRVEKTYTEIQER